MLVTGANSGIGLALVTELSQQGHTVFMACRSQAKCDEAAKSVPEPPMSSGAPRVIPMGEVARVPYVCACCSVCVPAQRSGSPRLIKTVLARALALCF